MILEIFSCVEMVNRDDDDGGDELYGSRFWRTLEEFQTSLWSTLVGVQSDLQDNGLLSARCAVRVRLPPSWVYITEALYKSIRVSLCRQLQWHSLYRPRHGIPPVQFIQFPDLRGSEEEWGVYKKTVQTETTYMEAQIKKCQKKQLFVLWWCFDADVSDPNKIESYHMVSGLRSHSNCRRFSHASAGDQVATARSAGAPLGSGLKHVDACLILIWKSVDTFVVPRGSALMTLASSNATVIGGDRRDIWHTHSPQDRL